MDGEFVAGDRRRLVAGRPTGPDAGPDAGPGPPGLRPAAAALRRHLAGEWEVFYFDGHGVWAWTCPACGAFLPKEEGQPGPSACARCAASLREPAAGYLALEQENGLMDPLPAAEVAGLLCPPTARRSLEQVRAKTPPLPPG